MSGRRLLKKFQFYNSLIKSHHLLQAPQASLHFNSIIVWLKDTKHFSKNKLFGFQFYNSLIKSQHACRGHWRARKFQFYNSLIKRIDSSAFPAAPADFNSIIVWLKGKRKLQKRQTDKFQFYNSLIKRVREAVARNANTHFNSIIVWLKAPAEVLAALAKDDFNSIIVWLKGLQREHVDGGPWFQFYNSLIKSAICTRRPRPLQNISIL